MANPLLLISPQVIKASIATQGGGQQTSDYQQIGRIDQLQFLADKPEAAVDVLLEDSSIAEQVQSKSIKLNVNFVSANALEFGFSFIGLMSEDLTGFSVDKLTKPVVSSIMAGLSETKLGCADGEAACNAIVASAPLVNLEIQSLPASATFRLWKSKPENIDQNPDFIFRVVIRAP